MFQRKAKAKENRIKKKHQKTKRFWCRYAQGKHPYPSRTRWLRLERPMVLCWRRHGRAGGCQIIYGGVAQLGEHLPCKQGVKSSNLSISIRYEEGSRQAEWSMPACTLKTTYWIYLEKLKQRRGSQERQTCGKRFKTSEVLYRNRYNRKIINSLLL